MRWNELLLIVVGPWVMASFGYVIGRWHERRITEREYSEWMNAPLQPLDPVVQKRGK